MSLGASHETRFQSERVVENVVVVIVVTMVAEGVSSAQLSVGAEEITPAEMTPRPLQ